MRRHDRRLKYVVLGLFVAVGSLAFLLGRLRSDDVDAASLANFDPGFIISDYTMSNYSSMSVAEIQAFLTMKNPCSNRDYSYYQALSASNPNVKWHWKDGHFVCLSEELFGDGMVIGEGKTAAQIIYETAQEYKINPQVLIVLIQKESSLITDPIPNNYDYRTMTGFGCPDTAPCDSKYFGFKNQIRKAAWLFREVLDGGWTNYPLGENYVQYNPNAGCGGSIVNIRNLATSALYRYTPYQPNAGAISAGYGTAYCGAYGNRNFYLYFEDWFGGIKNTYSEKLGRTIPDGTYQITSTEFSNLALDVYGGVYSGMDPEKVIAFEAKGEKMERSNQTFEIVYNSGSGYYNIYNKVAGLYLSMDGSRLTISGRENSCKQNWNLKRGAVGIYEMISACDGRKVRMSSEKAVDLSSGSSNWKFFEISGLTNAVEDGVYQISLSASPKYVLDVKGGVRANSTSGEMDIWKKKKYSDDWSNQIFDVAYDKNTGYYSIKNHLSGLILDVYNGETTNGTNVIGWTRNAGCNQRWMIKKADAGFTILSACSGKALDIKTKVAAMGQSVIIYEADGSSSQKWNFDDAVYAPEDYSGEYVLASAANQKMVLDIKGGVAKNAKTGDAIVFPRKTAGNSNQIFRIEKDPESDYYYIYNPESGLYLDVYGGYEDDGTRIIFWPYNGACNQKWRIESDNYGAHTIVSACSNKSLDIYGGNLYGGAPVILFPKHGKDNQKWLLFE